MPKPTVLTLPSPQPSCVSPLSLTNPSQSPGGLCALGTAQNPWDQPGEVLGSPWDRPAQRGEPGHSKVQTANCKLQSALWNIWSAANFKLPSLGTSGAQQTAACPPWAHLEHSKFQSALLGHIWSTANFKVPSLGTFGGTTNCRLPSLGTGGGSRAGAVPVPEPALSSHTLGPVQACCNLRRHFPGTAFHPQPGTKGVLFPPIPTWHSWESGVTHAAS